MTLFAEVILPLALPVNYTYRIPPHLAGEVVPGKRVAVQFGKSRIYSALVYRTTASFPSRYAPKEIIEVLDDRPVVTATQFRFWQWIAAYYMCTPEI
ncbi:MAG TPA: primosomal protein N', partial [Anseongella sp.]|nr:primosomal protein N' [Anseongella sp.]